VTKPKFDCLHSPKEHMPYIHAAPSYTNISLAPHVNALNHLPVQLSIGPASSASARVREQLECRHNNSIVRIRAGLHNVWPRRLNLPWQNGR
jgi:hypothetical protein